MVQAALARVSDVVMNGGLDGCVTTAIRGEDPVSASGFSTRF